MVGRAHRYGALHEAPGSAAASGLGQQMSTRPTRRATPRPPAGLLAAWHRAQPELIRALRFHEAVAIANRRGGLALRDEAIAPVAHHVGGRLLVGIGGEQRGGVIDARRALIARQPAIWIFGNRRRRRRLRR